VVDSNHPFLFNLYEDLAFAYASSGQGDSAAAIHRWLLGQRERVYGPDHPDVAFSLHSLGKVLIQEGHPDQAIPYLRRAVAIREKVGGPNHYLVGHTLVSLGTALYGTHDYAGSARQLTRSVDILSHSLGPTNHFTLNARVVLARCQAVAGNREAALKELETAAAAGIRINKADPAFASIARYPRFLALVAEKSPARP
jgi:tetratricopeptide (TPR) repeat protein